MEQEIDQYLSLREQLAGFQEQMRALVFQPKYIVPFLQPGRLVKLPSMPRSDQTSETAETHLEQDKLSQVWATVVNFEKGTPKDNPKSQKRARQYVVDVLVNCVQKKDASPDM